MKKRKMFSFSFFKSGRAGRVLHGRDWSSARKCVPKRSGGMERKRNCAKPGPHSCGTAMKKSEVVEEKEKKKIKKIYQPKIS